VGKVSIEKVTKAMLPYYLVMFVVLMLITYIPAITMFLPDLIMPGM